MTRHTTTLLVITLATLACATRAQTDDPAKKLSAFVGKWESSATFASGEKASSKIDCRWSPQSVYLICEQIVTLSGRQQRQLTVYSYNSNDSTYHYATFADPGTKPSEGTLEIKGNVWIYNFAFENAGKTTRIRNTNEFMNATHEVFKIVTSDDGGATWKPLLEGSAHKIGE